MSGHQEYVGRFFWFISVTSGHKEVQTVKIFLSIFPKGRKLSLFSGVSSDFVSNSDSFLEKFKLRLKSGLLITMKSFQTTV